MDKPASRLLSTRIGPWTAWIVPSILVFALALHVVRFSGSSASRVYGTLPSLGGRERPVAEPRWHCYVDVTPGDAPRVLEKSQDAGQMARDGRVIYGVNVVGSSFLVDGLFAPTRVKHGVIGTVWPVPHGPPGDAMESAIARHAALSRMQDDTGNDLPWITPRFGSQPIPELGVVQDEWVGPWLPGYRHNAISAVLLGGAILSGIWAFRRQVRPSGA